MDLVLPHHAKTIVLFAHGSGSSRFSTRNQFVAKFLQNEGLGTLLFDLLSQEEDSVENRFNIPLLAKRLEEKTTLIKTQYPDKEIAYFGASTGAAAALIASTHGNIASIVSRGGRPDLAQDALKQVTAPTLLIVGGIDFDVILLNQLAYQALQCEKKIEIVPGASHLFEEPGTLEQVASLASLWIKKHERHLDYKTAR